MIYLLAHAFRCPEAPGRTSRRLDLCEPGWQTITHFRVGFWCGRDWAIWGVRVHHKILDELQEMNVAALETELFGSFELAWT